MPWLLIALGGAVVAALIADPSYLVWLVVFMPVLLVLVPTTFPPIERKIAASVDARRTQRRAIERAKRASPEDAVAGLSLPDETLAGAVAVVDEDARDLS